MRFKLPNVNWKYVKKEVRNEKEKNDYPGEFLTLLCLKVINRVIYFCEYCDWDSSSPVMQRVMNLISR